MRNAIGLRKLADTTVGIRLWLSYPLRDAADFAEQRNLFRAIYTFISYRLEKRLTPRLSFEELERSSLGLQLVQPALRLTQ